MQVTGEVKRILAEESILNEKDRIDLSKLKPIIYDEEQVQYLAVGEKVADALCKCSICGLWRTESGSENLC